jgi:hypothetical protein
MQTIPRTDAESDAAAINGRTVAREYSKAHVSGHKRGQNSGVAMFH